jgi:hypothetical protein
MVKSKLIAVAAVLALGACNVGGTEPTVCELAADHVAACIGADPVNVSPVCGPDEAAQAQQALGMECSAFQDSVRSTTGLKDVICQFLPFLCQLVGGGGGNTGNPGYNAGGHLPPDMFRIQDCWQQPQGYCFDVVKVQGGCTVAMERPEWHRDHHPNFTHSECREAHGNRCRLARVCIQMQDKGQCVGGIPHHNDLPMCQLQDPPANQPPANQPPAGQCNDNSQCGGGICTAEHQCRAPGSVPDGGVCTEASGWATAKLCMPGLVCGSTSDKYQSPNGWTLLFRCKQP